MLTVEPHVQAHAELRGKLGSNHEMLMTRLKLLVPLDPQDGVSGRLVASAGCKR